MNFVKISEEVYYPSGGIVKVNKAEISQLKQFAQKATRRRSRLCTHEDTGSLLHEMLIVHENGIYVRPHKHLRKSESFHVIEGEVNIVIFDDVGNILDIIEMGNYVSGKVFYYRLSESLFHTVLVKSDIVVFHETTNGPFRREDTVFAEWSPEEKEAGATQQFVEDLKQQLIEFARR